MKLIVGLGNYTKEHKFSRHNVGFMMIDYLHDLGDFNKWNDSNKMLGYISEGLLFGTTCLLVKPKTYMNLSGNCVAKIMNFYKLKAENIIIIHDEADLDFGIVKTSNSRNSAGHNGVKSINSVILEPYNRVRVGIGRPNCNAFDIADYVLSNFTKEEQEKIKSSISQSVVAIIENYLK